MGLIGGSFALALRQAGFQGKIIGVSSPATIRAALDRGAIDEALPLAEAAAQSDVIYLAQPIEKILETLNVIDDAVRPGTLITDAGSTKQAIVERAGQTIRRGPFRGWASDGGQRGARSSGCGRESVSVAPVCAHGLRCHSGTLDRKNRRTAGETRRSRARSPGRAGLALAATAVDGSRVLDRRLTGSSAVAGPAAADLTRLALSPYDIWRDIFSTNAGEIDRVIGDAIARLQTLRENLLSESDMQATFARAAAQAASKLTAVLICWECKGETKMDDDSKMSFFFLGLGMGAAVGILFAPKSGSETRDFLMSKANEGADLAKRGRRT